MSVNEKQLQDKINGTIWSACDTLRSSIPGANYKDYALVMLFVKYLSDSYDVIEVKPFNMFPRTYHIENFVLLRRKNNG